MTLALNILLLVALLLVAVATVSVVACVFRLGISPMPSPPALRNAMVQELARYPSIRRVVDLGSGWGGLAAMAARACADIETTGIEASWMPFLFSRLWYSGAAAPANLTFQRGDLRSVTIRPETAYLCYLSTETMEALRERFEAHRPRNCVLISAHFAIRTWKPARSVVANDAYRTEVFVYEIGSPGRGGP